ncbi:hypothetical protein F5Y16DRAFT_238330 [Xylariaceae sp. FL0255]|nr:hypothetical protein F5Y16DRAFT_238330 [Xylariaceae sp. FL0255]
MPKPVLRASLLWSARLSAPVSLKNNGARVLLRLGDIVCSHSILMFHFPIPSPLPTPSSKLIGVTGFLLRYPAPKCHLSMVCPIYFRSNVRVSLKQALRLSFLTGQRIKYSRELWDIIFSTVSEVSGCS